MKGVKKHPQDYLYISNRTRKRTINGYTIKYAAKKRKYVICYAFNSKRVEGAEYDRFQEAVDFCQNAKKVMMKRYLVQQVTEITRSIVVHAEDSKSAELQGVDKIRQGEAAKTITDEHFIVRNIRKSPGFLMD